MPSVFFVGADHVSAASRMLTVVMTTAFPPLPAQFNVYVVSCVSGPTLCEPDGVLAPDQPPEAVQLVTSVPVHDNVVLVLDATLRGFAVKVTFGAAAVVTVTLAVFAVEPPAPVQVSVKFEFAVRAAVVCDPDIALVPLHAPDAVQLVAFVALHVS